MKIKESRGRKIFKAFNYTFLALLGIATFYPFWYVLIASFNTGRDFMRGGVWIWPRAFTLENYQMAFEDPTIGTSLLISVSATILSIVLGLIVTALAAYALSIKTLPGKTFMNFFWYFTTIFGGGMVPYYMVLRDLKLTSSFWLYVIPGLYSFYNFVLLRSNFATIHLPLSKPILATLTLFIGVGKWNDWFTGAYYQSKAALYPAATVLQKILSEATASSQIKAGQETQLGNVTSFTSQSLQMAFVMILTMPIVVIYPFLQKYYVKGVMVGSVKG